MNFEPFDPRGRVSIQRSLLPHWLQGGCTYFITWRTADSLPASLLRSWQAERERWLEYHQITLETLDHLPEEKRREFHQRFSKRWQDYLDEGHGECLLRLEEVQALVAAALQHFDGSRYALGDFVLMPNHVHLLVCPAADEDIQKLCASWKRFSARQINERLGRQGEFWQAESFDHIVRDQSALKKIQRYIAENPVKARLPLGSYRLYQPQAWQQVE